MHKIVNNNFRDFGEVWPVGDFDKTCSEFYCRHPALLENSRKITGKCMATQLPCISPLFYGRPVLSFTTHPYIYGQSTFYLTGNPRSFYLNYPHFEGDISYFRRQFTVF